MKNLKKGLFPFIIAFSALSVSGSAAFYSVYGLSKLFAGASFEVMVMAGSLEVAKLVTASLLYQYWNTINKLLRIYLSVATVVLVLITSMGIYGFLSAAYQDTFRQLTIKDNQTSFLEQKKDFYKVDVNRYDEELKRISDNIGTLSTARSQTIQVRDTSVAGGIRTTISTSGLRLASKRIEAEEENRKAVQFKREIAADSLQKYQFQILELENNFDVAGELGPLEYLSGLTGTPMDKIINILLLVIIFVFDPLAISLVVAANFAFNIAYPKRKKNLYGEKEQEEDTWEEFIENETYDADSKDLYDKEIDEATAEKRMNIIGQNGNDGEHYDNEFNQDRVLNSIVKDDNDGENSKDINLDTSEEFIGYSLKSGKRIKKILKKAHYKTEVVFMDNSTGWVDEVVTNNPKDNPNKIIYL